MSIDAFVSRLRTMPFGDEEHIVLRETEHGVETLDIEAFKQLFEPTYDTARPLQSLIETDGQKGYGYAEWLSNLHT